MAQNVALAVKIKSDDQARRGTGSCRRGLPEPGGAADHPRQGRRALAPARHHGDIHRECVRVSCAACPGATSTSTPEIIHVRQRADLWGRIGRPKSKAGNRDIPLAPMAVNALRAWKAECPAGDLGLVFPDGDGDVEKHHEHRRKLL